MTIYEANSNLVTKKELVRVINKQTELMLEDENALKLSLEKQKNLESQLAKKDEIIKDLKKLSDEAKELLQQSYCAISLQEWIDSHHEAKKKIEELENVGN